MYRTMFKTSLGEPVTHNKQIGSSSKNWGYSTMSTEINDDILGTFSIGIIVDSFQLLRKHQMVMVYFRIVLTQRFSMLLILFASRED